MKNLFSVLKASLLALAVAGSLYSCKPDDKTGGLEVKLTALQQGVSSVTFNISCENAARLAYIQVADLSSVPSAEGIMTAGTPVEVPGQDVTLEGLTPSTTYYVAAVAASESGVYSNVATLEIATIGNDCDFDIQILGVSGSSISYMVNPSDTSVAYYVAAVKTDSLITTEATEIELYNVVVDSVIASAAEAAGLSESDYLSQNLVKGIFRGAARDLTPATEYLIVAMGLSADGALTTPVAFTNAATNSSSDDDLRFELGYSDLTATTVTLTLVPTDESATYYMLCQTQQNYPDYTEESGALAFANAAVEVYGMYLDQNIGLYTGTQTVTKFAVNPETKYYYFAFGYVPGIGINEHSCALTSFTTPRGEQPEDFSAEINVRSASAKTVTWEVTPTLSTVYYTSAIVEASEFNIETIKKEIVAGIEEYFLMQRANNPTYTMEDAVQSVCERGADKAEFMQSGLEPLTDYKIIAISVSNAGVPTDAYVTADVKTSDVNNSKAELTSKLVDIYEGSAVLNAGLFPEAQKLDGYALVVMQVAANADADPAKCFYYLYNGDVFSQHPDSSDYVDDDFLLNMITDDVAVEGGWLHTVNPNENEGYLFLSNIGWWDKEPYNYGWFTFLTVAQDRDGVYGKLGRTEVKCLSTEVGDISDLVELLDRLEVQQMSSPLRLSERGAARW